MFEGLWEQFTAEQSVDITEKLWFYFKRYEEKCQT